MKLQQIICDKFSIGLFLAMCFLTLPLIAAAQGKIAFTSNRNGNEEIYVMSANGSNQTNLTNNAAIDSDPSWGGAAGIPTPTPTPTATPTPSNVCTPTTTVTEGDLFPGGIVSFGVASGPGSVTIDHVNAGTGLQSLTMVGVPINAVLNIPVFAPGTTDPVAVTFTTPDPTQLVDFTIRAASTFHAVNIRARCNFTGQNKTERSLTTRRDLKNKRE